MTAEEDDACRAFHRSCIEPKVLSLLSDSVPLTEAVGNYQVLSDWFAEDSAVTKNWMELVNRYRPSEALKQRWREIAEHWKAKRSREESDRDDKEKLRILKSMQRFLAANPHLIGSSEISEAKRYKSLFEEGDFVDRKRVKSESERNAMWPAKLFLPNSLTTEAVIRFRTVPGFAISNALRALCTQILLGNVPATADSQQLLCYMIHGQLSPSENLLAEESLELLTSRLQYWAYKQPRLRCIK